MRGKFFVWAGLCLVLGVAAIFFVYGWFFLRMERVEKSLARSTFPYSDYTVEELEQMYPQTLNEDVKTTVTPEETHAKFVAALKNGDIDGAVECCFKREVWEKMKKGLNNVKSNGHLDEMIKDLDTKITPNMLGDTKTSYNYLTNINGKKYNNNISFIKDSTGTWLIESL